MKEHRIVHYFTHVYALAASSLFIKNVLFNGYAILGKNTVNYVPTGFLLLQVFKVLKINKITINPLNLITLIFFFVVYSPDMPKRLPLKDIISGLVSSLARAIRFWLHYTLVAMAWLGIVPLTACRIYRCLFTGSVSSVLTLPLDMLSS